MQAAPRWRPHIHTAADLQIARGRYLVKAADCAACHTDARTARRLPAA